MDAEPLRTRVRWWRVLAQVKLRLLGMVIQWQRRTSCFNRGLLSWTFQQLRLNWTQSLDSLDRMVRGFGDPDRVVHRDRP